MAKFIETTGRSEEDAIAAALFQLGLDRDDVSVEVLERAKTGFFGFGSSPARVAAEEAARQAKEDEKRRKEEARLERAKRIEEEKLNKKKHKAEPKPESSEPGVNKDDSREGLRAYARGRAYMPDRFGGVTPYVDPNIAMKAEAEAAAKAKKSSKKNKEEK